jgi:hypothetical protein
MTNISLIIVIIVLVIILVIVFLIYNARKQYQYDELAKQKLVLATTNDTNTTDMAKLQTAYKNLLDIKFADENIFKFIRCINIPQSPVCARTGTGGTVCRSKLIDCNKFKLVLENDPVAVERMKLATDKYYQVGKPHNLSELTNPIKNVSWFF